MDLEGWSLSEGLSFTFPSGAVIAAGGFVVVTPIGCDLLWVGLSRLRLGLRGAAQFRRIAGPSRTRWPGRRVGDLFGFRRLGWRSRWARAFVGAPISYRVTPAPLTSGRRPSTLAALQEPSTASGWIDCSGLRRGGPLCRRARPRAVLPPGAGPGCLQHPQTL